MATVKNVNICYYRVEIEGQNDSAREFIKLCERIYSTNMEDRATEINYHNYRIREIQKDGEYWNGIVSHIRMDKDATKEDLHSGLDQSIPLEETEGLSEYTAFSYHSKLNTIGIQTNRHGINASNLALLFAKIGKSSTAVIFTAWLLPDAYDRILSGKPILWIKTKIAMPENPAKFGAIDSLNNVIGFMGNVKATQLELYARADRKVGLKMAAIRKIINFFQKNPGAAKRVEAKVQGIEKPINLNVDVLKDTRKVSLEETSRDIGVRDLLDAMQFSWRDKESIVKQLVTDGYE